MADRRKLRQRRLRRSRKAVSRHGPKAKPVHKAKTGRTGNIYRKRQKSVKGLVYMVSLPSKRPKFEVLWIFEGLK